MNDASPEILTGLSPEHLAELRAARDTLENPSFAMQAASLLGTPIEKGLAILPDGWRRTVKNAVQGALEKAAHFALGSITDTDAATVIGHLIVHHASGWRSAIPLTSGECVNGSLLTTAEEPILTAPSRIAWQSPAPGLPDHRTIIYQSSWVNPWPAEPITAITFSSTMETGGPILFAITAEP